MSVATRPSPPYRDWISLRGTPPIWDELVNDTRFHYRCLLGFRGDRSAGTQTEDDINFRVANSPSTPQITALAKPKGRPPMRPDSARYTTSIQPDFRIQIDRPTFSPLYAQDDATVIPQAHVSAATRGSFLQIARSSTNQFLTQSGRRPVIPGPGRPEQRAIQGPLHVFSPVDSRPLPPVFPPSDQARDIARFGPRPEGMRFLYTEPARYMRTHPEVTVPRPFSNIPDDPETNPDA